MLDCPFALGQDISLKIRHRERVSTDEPGKLKASFTEGSINRHVFHLSSIMVAGFLVMTICNLIEIFYIGVLGKIELAAITFMLPVSMSLNALARGIGVGAATLVAQHIGQGDLSRSSLTITHCCLLTLLFSLGVLLLGQVAAGPLFALLGAQEEVLAQAVGYARIWLIGFPLLALAMVSNGLIRAFGNASYPGYIMATGPILQVLFGPLVIFGLAGLPALGLAGAAWAFTAGALLQVLMALGWYLRNRLLAPSLHMFLAYSRSILQVGIPAAATNLIQPLSGAVVTWLLAGYGTETVAGFGVASRIEAVASMVVIGIAGSVVPLVGQNWGAARYQRAYQALKACYIACFVWGLMAAVIMWSWAPFFVSTINKDPGLLKVAVTFLYIVPFSIGFMGLLIVSINSFNALRRPVPALLLSAGRLLLIYVPMALLAGYYFGYPGIFAAMAAANVLVGLAGLAWNQQAMRHQERKLDGPV